MSDVARNQKRKLSSSKGSNHGLQKQCSGSTRHESFRVFEKISYLRKQFVTSKKIVFLNYPTLPYPTLPYNNLYSSKLTYLSLASLNLHLPNITLPNITYTSFTKPNLSYPNLTQPNQNLTYIYLC